MDKNEKNAKKRIINKDIDLSNGRYKDSEIDTLYDIVTNFRDYAKYEIDKCHSHDGWSSDGKFTREEKNSYSFKKDDTGIYVHHEYAYEDDDGQTGGYDRKISTGRDILNILNVFRR